MTVNEFIERRRSARPAKAAWPQFLPHNQDQAEVRLVSFIMTMGFGYFSLEPIVYAWAVESSMLLKVAMLTGHENLILGIMAFSVALLIPHAMSLAFFPRLLDCKVPRRMAFTGALFTSILWYYLGDLSRPLDAGPLAYLYGVRCASDLLMAGVFAFSLNSQQLRELIHARTAD